MRVLPAFLIVGLMSGVAGCAVGHVLPVALPAATPAPSASASPGAASAAEPQRRRTTTERYRGSGDQLISITPTRQLGLITADTHGTGDFSVHSVNAAGEDVELLAEGEDQHRGTRLFNRQDEENVTALRVTAQGPWTIMLKPLASSRMWSGRQASGSGDDVLLLDPKAAGSEKITSRFDGDGAFVVEGISTEGSVLLADEFGACAVEEELPDGTVLIIVEGDGSWMLRRTVPDLAEDGGAA
ncbi:hypothetical protein PS9374_07068 [Planomonospora sphaerica]|uniref:Lipoprotein n=1 Tax=Planomonospora sphaerica TaxID=161355 RepID=A0A161LP44_9ACTN|nr:hypothetical protein [Planomonospora sphaerica]GAT71377.1 hypothetical protein PS9374_07068 [Planomonospora sphaerica]